MPESRTHAKRKLYWFVGAIVVATIYFFAGERKVTKIGQLDVHSGAVRIETQGYWGGITYQSRKPWREAELRSLFSNAGAPRWLPISKAEQRVLPDLSSSARRKAWSGGSDDLYEASSNSMFITVNLSQVLNAPHISDSTRRDLIYLSFDTEEPSEPSSNFHILDRLRQEVLDVTAFSDARRREWQERLDRDDGGDIIAFLKEASQYPAKELDNKRMESND